MFALLLGHIAGDYLFQNDYLARNKSGRGLRATAICALHCIIYSLCVACAIILDGWRTVNSSMIYSAVYAFLIAFITHYPIDRISFGKTWMHFFKQSVDGPFAPLVYVAIDNGLHLILMYVLFKCLGA